MTEEKLNPASVREKLASLTSLKGRKYWKSIEELADSDDLLEAVRRDYPSQAHMLDDHIDRRKFMQIMGASLALAGVTACKVAAPDEKIVPYVRAPEEIIYGKPLFFATAMPLSGFGKGLLVESNMGRPTKIEGNPDHPGSLGGTDVFQQASILNLYDPDRSQAVRYFGDIKPWNVFLREFRELLAPLKAKQGAGLRILTETTTSPTLHAQIQAILKDFPQAKRHQFEPVNRDNVLEGAKAAFGSPVETLYKFDKADVVVSLESDFLTHGPAGVRHTRDFSSKRKVRGTDSEINRLYVVESMPSNTGTVADHRFPMKSSDILAFAQALAAAVEAVSGTAPTVAQAKLVEAIAKDLKAKKGKSVVIAGDHQPAAVHTLVHAMNQALGNVGTTVQYVEPVEAEPVNQLESLKQLTAEMNSGQVELLLILGGNPAFNAPSDLNFQAGLAKVKTSIHLSMYYDETSALCNWHVPEAHYLESWSDVRAFDGTVSVIQPLIAPLYKEAKTVHEVLAMFTDQFNQASFDIVRGYWKTQKTTGDFEHLWRKALHDGFVPETASAPKAVTLQTAAVTTALSARPPAGGGLEVVFGQDPAIFDGRYANNGWLQELPKPITKITWDNAAFLSKKTAAAKGVKNMELIEVGLAGGKVRLPAWIVPGHADDCVTLHFGYGRKRAGRVGNETGFDVYPLRKSPVFWGGLGATISATGDKYLVATTQTNHDMVGRELIRQTSIEKYKKNPKFAKIEEADRSADRLSLHGDDHTGDNNGYSWGMAIDLNLCTGCNACVVACQSENNSPVVGKVEVDRQRAMHWMRIDRYFEGEAEAPEIHVQPVMCQHCEAAPCEVVCPVEATSHSVEGINEMTYNRCIGTKYCLNNCPYKVRRFNFFAYSDFDTVPLKLSRNPNVTVRSRGVMEKCTYCVQRVNEARMTAEKEDRLIRDGEVVAACQGACPAEAITFGNIADPRSRVSKLRAEPTNYGLLAELNTRPRTTYLAKVRNPNPELETEHKKSH